MNIEPISSGIKHFFEIQRSSSNMKIKSYRPSLIQTISPKLTPQTVTTFQHIICEIIRKIGKECRVYHPLTFNIKINQYHILKCFIHFKLVNNSRWLFKYRKYYSSFHALKIRLEKKKLKSKKLSISVWR